MSIRAAVRKYGPAVKRYAKAAVVSGATVGGMAMAQVGTTEPDPTAGVAVIAGCTAVIITVANSKYIVQGTKWAAGKIGSMFGR